MASVAEVRLDRVQVAGSNVLGEVGTGWQILDHALEKALPFFARTRSGRARDF
jgi:alkylation response protein AidB-like acyl-CoA dehydrogenase